MLTVSYDILINLLPFGWVDAVKDFCPSLLLLCGPVTNSSSSATGVTKFLYHELYYPPVPACCYVRDRDGGSASYSYTRVSLSRNSTSSAQYFRKKKITVQFRPKRPIPRAPVSPRLRLTPWPETPVKRPGQSGRSFARVMSRHQQKLDSIKAKRQRQLAAYHLAYERYLRRLDHYKRLMALVVSGRPAYKKVRGPKVLVNNPFTETRTVTIPAYGSFTDWTGNSITGCRSSTYVYNGNANLYNKISGYVEPFYPSSWTHNSAAVAGLACVTTAAESAALNNMLSQLNKQEVHVGNIIAERHQTIGMLRGIVTALADLNPRRWIRNSKDIANHILAFKFGVEPLLADAHGLGVALAKVSNQPDKLVVHGRSKRTVTETTQSTTLSAGSPWTYNTLTTKRTVEVHYVCEYTINNGALSLLQSVGLVNPAEIAWEVMPWSFVVDWFLPIGNYINLLSCDAGLVFSGGTKTVKTTDVTTYTRRGTGIHSQSYYWLTGSSTASRHQVTKTRTVLSNAPRPSFPDFKNPYSSTHFVEALALLRQRFS